eukprot:TRINITY_DN34495_c0_g2_i1.p1 TRINITY_DN34495_c0_g2~~TRINITY_DN34495_c0_g2_i1.p1  ORF type:complete len:1035 (+),score=150.26 TRINITY_DN34495_c0_g2_i1:78-3182(+)
MSTTGHRDDAGTTVDAARVREPNEEAVTRVNPIESPCPLEMYAQELAMTHEEGEVILEELTGGLKTFVPALSECKQSLFGTFKKDSENAADTKTEAVITESCGGEDVRGVANETVAECAGEKFETDSVAKAFVSASGRKSVGQEACVKRDDGHSPKLPASNVVAAGCGPGSPVAEPAVEHVDCEARSQHVSSAGSAGLRHASGESGRQNERDADAKVGDGDSLVVIAERDDICEGSVAQREMGSADLADDDHPGFAEDSLACVEGEKADDGIQETVVLVDDDVDKVGTPETGGDAIGLEHVAQLASPQRKKLEPSVQALAASCSIVRPANVGPSESSHCSGRVGGGSATAARQHRRRRRPGTRDHSIGSGSSDRSIGKASRSSSTRRGISTAELEDLMCEEKRQELRDMCRRNAKSCHDAIHYPFVPLTSGAASTELTMPQEFNLSCSNRSVCSSSVGHVPADAEGERGSEWHQSLRGRSKSRNVEPWRPQLTVPTQPRLRTEERSRSRSASQSRGSTPEARSRSSTPGRGEERALIMTPIHGRTQRESNALDQHLDRMIAGKIVAESPCRRRMIASSGRRSTSLPPGSTSQGLGDEATGVGENDASSSSAFAAGSQEARRLSRLSQPSPSRRGRSSDDIQVLRMEIKRREMTERIRTNERNCFEAILNPDLQIVPSPILPTVPRGPNLRTPQRARSRSSEVDGSESSRHRGLSEERRAAALAIVASEAAIALSRSKKRRDISLADECSVASKASVEVARGGIQIPDGVNHQQWVRDGATAEERAQRARAVAVAKTEKASASRQAGLCIFKSSVRDWAPKPGGGGGKRAVGAPHCIFKPSNRKPVTSATPETSSASSGSAAVIAEDESSGKRGLSAVTLAAVAAEAATGSLDGLPSASPAGTAATAATPSSAYGTPNSRPTSARGVRVGVGVGSAGAPQARPKFGQPTRSPRAGSRNKDAFSAPVGAATPRGGVAPTRTALGRADSSKSLNDRNRSNTPHTPRARSPEVASVSKARKPQGVGFGSRTSRPCMMR